MKYQLKTDNNVDITVETTLDVVDNGNTLFYENIRIKFIHSDFNEREKITELSVDILPGIEEYNQSIYATVYSLDTDIKTSISLDNGGKITISFDKSDMFIKVII